MAFSRNSFLWKQGTVHSVWLIFWLLMIWKRSEQRHQQLQHSPSYPLIFLYQHQTDWYVKYPNNIVAIWLRYLKIFSWTNKRCIQTPVINIEGKFYFQHLMCLKSNMTQNWQSYSLTRANNNHHLYPTVHSSVRKNSYDTHKIRI